MYITGALRTEAAGQVIPFGTPPLSHTIDSTMGFFQRPHYESDTTRFLRELKNKKPEIDAKQREGRALLWDRALDLDEEARFRAAKVPQQAYVYQTQPKTQ